MSATTTPLVPNFDTELVTLFLKDIDTAQKQSAHLFWSMLISFLEKNWLVVILVLAVVLFLSALQAFTTRRWGWFGSVLYNYFYFGTLFVIGWIWGPEIFVSTFFDIFAFILYVCCFLLVRKILAKTGLHKPSLGRRRYRRY